MMFGSDQTEWKKDKSANDTQRFHLTGSKDS